MFVSRGSAVFNWSKRFLDYIEENRKRGQASAVAASDPLFFVAPQTAESEDTRPGIAPMNRARFIRL